MAGNDGCDRVTVAAEERARLARELHDSVSQDLFIILMHARVAQAALRRVDGPEVEQVRHSLDVVLDRAQAGVAEMRTLLVELRRDGLQAEGLVRALGRHAAAVSAREGLPVVVHGPTEILGLADSTVEDLYRLVQEALHNVVKHAQATCVQIEVQVDCGELTVTIRDDGAGFDPAVTLPGHFGRRTMAERAFRAGGAVQIDSSPGLGTTVTARVPLRVGSAAVPPQRTADDPIDS